jgi:hypothetical protein
MSLSTIVYVASAEFAGGTGPLTGALGVGLDVVVRGVGLDVVVRGAGVAGWALGPDAPHPVTTTAAKATIAVRGPARRIGWSTQ